MSLPYGDSESCMPEPTENLYTGKERDTETAGGVSPFGANEGNDYFGARYYSSVMGRWMSPDYGSGPVPYASFTDPQSLNLYGYVGNNPLGGVDADGHCDFGYEDTHCGAGSLINGWKQDMASWNAGEQPTDAGSWLDNDEEFSPTQYTYEGENFNTFSDLASQLINEAAMPANQAYAAYMLDCAHTTSACEGNDTVTTRYEGITGNYALIGHPIDPSSMGEMIRDPSFTSKAFHGGPSWYQSRPIYTGHVASTSQGWVESHHDNFGITALPLHFLLDVLPSLFINPKPGVPGPTYHCSPEVGCSE